MVVSYPMVNNHGNLNGGEVTCRFQDVFAVSHLMKYVRNIDGGMVDHYEVVTGCVTIYVKDTSYDVQADYEELKQKLKSINEWSE